MVRIILIAYHSFISVRAREDRYESLSRELLDDSRVGDPTRENDIVSNIGCRDCTTRQGDGMRGSTRRVMFIGGAVLVTTLLLGGVALALAVGGTVVGAPDHAVVRASGDVRWILPGSRQLDPDIFGTPDKPLGFEPGVGVPIEARNVSADGTEFTATKQPGPFSDNWAQVSGGSWIRVTDRTAVAGPSTEDRIRGEFRFTSPDGEHDY